MQNHGVSATWANGCEATESRPVVICGAGAAGIAAALAAARRGAEVWLIETRARIGGTVAHALIHTLGGFFDCDGELLNDGLAEEIVETLQDSDPSVSRRKMGRTWVLSVAPELYLNAVERLIAGEPQIRVLTSSCLTNVECREGRIVQVDGRAHHEEFRITPRAVVDASGTGELVRQIDPVLVDDDPRRAAGGLIFRLHGIAPDAITFPKGLAVVRALHDAAAKGTIPACRHAWVDRGLADNEVYVKLFVPTSTANSDRGPPEQLSQCAVQVPKDILHFLRQLPGFDTARVDRVGEIGIRDGGRVLGEYQLTGTDIRQGRRFDDAACRGCWPIEYWHPQQGLSLEYLPGNQSYDVPLRSLKVRGLQNVWVAGKCLSADREAQASARVVGCCWAMGEAVGKAAVQ